MSGIQSYLAALAVFSELYDNKKDVLSVLWEFIKYILIKNRIWQFKLEDIKEALKVEYNFDNIPNAVLKTLFRKSEIKDYIQYDKEIYNVTPLLKKKSENIYIAESEEQNKRISIFISDLKDYVKEHNQDIEISDKDILNALQEYLLQEKQTSKLAVVINEYVVERKELNKDVYDVLNQIKEGFILYEGLSWCDDLNELEYWKTPLTLYYDMDIIFYMAGFSGEIYLTIFNEMHTMIKEMNSVYARKHKGKRCIYTKYFPEVKDQIDEYFDIAQQIIENKKSLDPSQTAMRYLVTTCDTPSQLARKRSDLDILLKNNGILEDDKSVFYSVDQHIDNIESNELINKYAKSESKEKVERYLRRINYINILRKGHECKNFKTCEVLLVTRNKLCGLIDNDEDSKIKNQFSRVISPETLTSKMWFLLNKGFGKNKLPLSLDVLTQAKVIMAHQINKDISVVYEKLIEEYKTGKVSIEQATACIMKVRQISILPENVSAQVLAETHSMSESSIQELVKKYEEENRENKEKEQQVYELQSEIVELKREKEASERKVIQEIAASQEKDDIIKQNSENITQKNDEIENLKKELNNYKEKEDNIKRILHWTSIGVFVIMMILTIIFFVMKQEQFAKISSLVGVVDFLLGMGKKYIGKQTKSNTRQS